MRTANGGIRHRHIRHIHHRALALEVHRHRVERVKMIRHHRIDEVPRGDLSIASGIVIFVGHRTAAVHHLTQRVRIRLCVFGVDRCNADTASIRFFTKASRHHQCIALTSHRCCTVGRQRHGRTNYMVGVSVGDFISAAVCESINKGHISVADTRDKRVLDTDKGIDHLTATINNGGGPFAGH